MRAYYYYAVNNIMQINFPKTLITYLRFANFNDSNLVIAIDSLLLENFVLIAQNKSIILVCFCRRYPGCSTSTCHITI